MVVQAQNLQGRSDGKTVVLVLVLVLALAMPTETARTCVLGNVSQLVLLPRGLPVQARLARRLRGPTADKTTTTEAIMLVHPAAAFHRGNRTAALEGLRRGSNKIMATARIMDTALHSKLRGTLGPTMCRRRLLAIRTMCHRHRRHQREKMRDRCPGVRGISKQRDPENAQTGDSR